MLLVLGVFFWDVEGEMYYDCFSQYINYGSLIPPLNNKLKKGHFDFFSRNSDYFYS